MNQPTAGSADQPFEKYEAHLNDKCLFKVDDGMLSEADTRSKFIDPVFKDVLGWNESDIRREKPVAQGYVDYVLGSDYSYLLIEAKRSKPRFQLNATEKPRRLKLSGPHLLGNRKVQTHISQAQSYASDIGVQFCLLTNGSQFVIFRPYLPGRPWKQGMAIVFHDHRDILKNFAEFYDLLSRDRVISGSLIEAFEHLERVTTQLYVPLNYVRDPDRELVRNKVWRQIAGTMTPLLTDQSEDLSAQIEVIKNCYVTTPLADQTDKNLDALLKDTPPQYLTDAGVVDLRPGKRGKTAFSHRFESDLQSTRRVAYILTGGVGSGKTTFLKRFAHIVDREFVERYTVWIHVDFLPIGDVDDTAMEQELRKYVYARIREGVLADFSEELVANGDMIRELFGPEIQEARLTLLFSVEESSPEWVGRVNQIVHDLFTDDEQFVLAALRHLRTKRGRRIAIALDNTDQLGETFQQKVFLLAQKLSAEHSALCVVTLREEKFFAAYRRGIFDAFGDRRFHIGSPDLRIVLKKRLEYGITKFVALQRADDGSGLSEEDFKRIVLLLRVMLSSTVGRYSNIVRMLASVSNGDMRHSLDMFREFLSSGNTNVDKIIDKVEREGGYTVPFHEFAKSAILGSRKYYRSNTSHIVNVFKQSDALGASHLTAARVLRRLAAAVGAASAHAEGFVALSTLLREYRQSFGFAEDFMQWAGELLRRKLIESEPPRVADVATADALRITAAGAYYWQYLIRAFAYVDLMLVDTPIADQALAERLGEMAEHTEMSVRFSRVNAFLDFLAAKEAAELAVAAERVGPFQEPILPDLKKQVRTEMTKIGTKFNISVE